MPFAIRVKENDRSDTPWRFEVGFPNREEFKPVSDLCLNKKRFSNLDTALGHVRTDNWANFSRDFFFPTLLEALKTKDLATKIFLAIGSFFFDLLTFPLRLITILPRYFTNRANTKEHHPLFKYLSERKADARVLEPDHIYLQIEKEVDGVTKVFEQTFNYIELPESAGLTKRLVKSHVLELADLAFLIKS